MRWLALLPQASAGDWPGAEASARLNLGWRALSFSPRVTLMEEAVLVEVSSCLRLFGGLPALMQSLLRDDAHPAHRLPPPRWAEGPTALLALARLRAGRPPLRDDAESTRLLPLSSLGAAREHLEMLERIGCRTWGELRRLPREGIVRRFGQPLLDALDRAEGLQPESHDWLALPETFDASLELPALVEEAPGLMFAAQRLLTRLRLWLSGRHAGVLGLKLIWSLDARRDVPPRGELLVRSASPTRDMVHLGRLLAEHLAHVRLPAPVHALRLLATETTPWAPATSTLLVEEQSKGQPLEQFIERVSARLGPHRVLRWTPRADHRPERRQAWVPAQSPVQAAAFEPGPHDAMYPDWLLREPRRLRTNAQDRPVYQGQALTLRLGPHRIEASGWAGQDTAPVMRDYFIAESPKSGLLWVYHERLASAGHAPPGTAHWYLHGFFS